MCGAWNNEENRMKWFAFSVMDTDAGYYERPIVARSEHEGRRMMVDIVASGEGPIANHPESFVLMVVGHWDDNQGHFDPCVPQKVITGLEAVALAKAKLGVLNKENLEELDDA